MINVSLLQEQVWEIVSSLVSVPVIIEEQEGYEPAENFLTVKLRDWGQIGSSTQRHSGSNSNLFTVKSLWKTTMRVTGVGVDSNQLLLEIAHKFNKDSTRNKFKAFDLVYNSMSHVINAPKLLNTGWEQRYVLDVYFHIIIEDTDDLGYIEFVEVTVEATDETDTVVYEETRTIDIIP